LEACVLEGSWNEQIPLNSTQSKGVYYYNIKDQRQVTFRFDNASNIPFYQDCVIYDGVATGKKISGSRSGKNDKKLEYAFTFPAWSMDKSKLALQVIKQVRSGSALFIVVADVSIDGKATSVAKVNAGKGLQYMFDKSLSRYDVPNEVLVDCLQYAQSLDEFKPFNDESSNRKSVLTELHGKFVSGGLGGFTRNRFKTPNHNDTDAEDIDEDGEISAEVSRYLKSSDGQKAVQAAVARNSKTKSTDTATMKAVATAQIAPVAKQLKELEKKLNQRSQLSSAFNSDEFAKKSEVKALVAKLVADELEKKKKATSPQLLNPKASKAAKNVSNEDASMNAVAEAAQAQAAAAAAAASASAAAATQAVALATAASRPSELGTIQQVQNSMILNLPGVSTVDWAHLSQSFNFSGNGADTGAKKKKT